MKLSDFDYDLPKELIAQKPIKPRDHSRLLVLPKNNKDKIEHKYFYEIVEYLQSGDILVLNNSKVFPARLIGKKAETGGKIEIFLLKKITPPTPLCKGGKEVRLSPPCKGGLGGYWQCLVGGKIRKAGLVVEFSKSFQAEILKDNQDGTWEVKFNLTGKKFWQAVERFGQMPLPPYIKSRNTHHASHIKEMDDKRSYQTIYANEKKIGSVAAPTAGFHFTKGLLAKIKKKGVQIEYVTLHVGLGTFAPVKVDNIKKHKIHSEFVEVSRQTIQNIFEAKAEGRRIIAVGTTSVRTLESTFWKLEIACPRMGGNWKLGRSKTKNTNIQTKTKKSISFWTDIFIYPGYKFKVVDAMITNFHLPKSTLLMLVSAFAGQKGILCAYYEAIRKKYMFFSYGDAMFIC